MYTATSIFTAPDCPDQPESLSQLCPSWRRSQFHCGHDVLWEHHSGRSWAIQPMSSESHTLTHWHVTIHTTIHANGQLKVHLSHKHMLNARTADHPLVLHLCNGANTNRWRSEEESGGAQASWVTVERVHRSHPRPCPPLVGPRRAPCCSSSPSSADTPAWRERVPTSRSRSGSLTAARELQV